MFWMMRSFKSLSSRCWCQSCPGSPPCCWSCFQRLHERGVSKMNWTNSDQYFFVVMIEIALGFTCCSTCGILVAVFLVQCVWRRTWSYRLTPGYVTGVSSLRPTSVFASDPSFLLERFPHMAALLAEALRKRTLGQHISDLLVGVHIFNLHARPRLI